MLTQKRLKELLHYNPKTGEFRWRVNQGNRQTLKGLIAGCLDTKGYLVIKVDQKKYYGSQLAFLYMRGKFARPTADHKNRNPSDTRWCNLREATHRQNIINSKPRGRSGLKGAAWNGNAGKWMATIRVDGKRLFLGNFDSKVTAHRTYMKAAKYYHGEFAYADLPSSI